VDPGGNQAHFSRISEAREIPLMQQEAMRGARRPRQIVGVGADDIALRVDPPGGSSGRAGVIDLGKAPAAEQISMRPRAVSKIADDRAIRVNADSSCGRRSGSVERNESVRGLDGRAQEHSTESDPNSDPQHLSLLKMDWTGPSALGVVESPTYIARTDG